MANWFNEIFRRKPKMLPLLEGISVKDLPVGGQVSVNTNTQYSEIVGALTKEFNTVLPKYPVEYLTLIDTLSVINPDMSQAVSNIVLLGNTGHMLSVSGDDAEQAAKRINHQASRLYRRSAGIDGLINAQLSQIARSGALSVEWVPSRGLKDGIEKVIVVPTSSIRFVYDPAIKDFYPVQETGTLVKPVTLNPHTYRYYALDTLDDSPYAIPPFISALESVFIQRDMIANLKFISKKLGLLGFLNLMVSAPTPKAGESDEAYKLRCETYLRETATRLKDNLREGIAIGFKDAQEFHHTSVTGDARGAADLFKMNEELVASGLKQDPSMLGRNYSNNSTYVGVIYEKMMSQHLNYQRLIKRQLEWGYGLDLALVGIDAEIGVNFKMNKSLNAVLDAAAEIKNVQVARMLWEDGVIDQDERARRLGYDKPDQLEPRVDPTKAQAPEGTTPPTSAKKPKEPVARKPKNRTQQSLNLVFHRERQQYEFVRDSIDLNMLGVGSGGIQDSPKEGQEDGSQEG